jgi:acyl carrier protein
MNKAEVSKELKDYISREILDGKDIGLDDSTPLLEWGIINSMEIAKMVSFIEDRFQVGIPEDKISAEYFMSLGAISDLVVELSE